MYRCLSSFLVLTVLAACGCGDTPVRACVNVVPDLLATSAARFAIEIFRSGTRCENYQAPKNLQPLRSYRFDPGETFALDNAPVGAHVVVVTAYADPMTSIGNAGACVEINFSTSKPACTGIKIERLCVDNADNCGTCGTVCSSLNVSERACTGGLCSSLCRAGFNDCNKNKLVDGCECETVDSAQPACCGTGCQIRHFTGLIAGEGVSQSWVDCAPLDTYDETEAMRACAAFKGGDLNTVCEALGCKSGTSGGAGVVCALPKMQPSPTDPCGMKEPGKSYACWSLAGYKYPGLVGSTCGTCPSQTDPAWH